MRTFKPGDKVVLCRDMKKRHGIGHHYYDSLYFPYVGTATHYNDQDNACHVRFEECCVIKRYHTDDLMTVDEYHYQDFYDKISDRMK